MSSTEEDDVLAALARYRWSIAQHNRQVFTTVVQKAEAFQDFSPCTPEELNARRMEFINDQFSGEEGYRPGPDPAAHLQTPADVFKKWPELVCAYGLDGVMEWKSDEDRERDRASFREGIMTGLQERLGEDAVTGIEFPIGFLGHGPD